MIRHKNENGFINVSTSVFTDIAGTAATNCFGVKGMAARSLTDGVYHLLRLVQRCGGIIKVYHGFITLAALASVSTITYIFVTPPTASLSVRP